MTADAPGSEPLPARWDRAAWGGLVVVIATASVLMLVGLGGGTLRVYDEGLYGSLARNALEHGQGLYAVDARGEFYDRFSKPPLTIMAVAASFRGLGVSLMALRLPFALSMIASVGVVFAWGRRIGGTPFGLAWSGALLLCAASVRWGRVACIEPMLMLWILTGLWAYHEALVRPRSGRRWAMMAGLALVLAVGTKQIVVLLAVGPIVALELGRRRWREAWPRLVLTLGPPTIAGLGWLGLVVHRVGDAAIETYVRFAVVRRIEGYRSGIGQRSLNELADVLTEACAPFPWVLGVVGLVMLVIGRPAGRRSAAGSLLLPLLLLMAVLTFENLSSSALPWYAYDVVVPLTGGLGFLVAGLASRAEDRWSSVRWAGGALTLATGAVGALTAVVSQLNAAVLLGLVVILLARRGGERARARGAAALVGVGAVALVLGTATRPELRTPPGGHEQLMARLAAQGRARIDVHVDTALRSELAWRTYYGPHAQRVTRSPWRRRTDAEAYVTGALWPSEIQPREGRQILRAPGVMAVVGPLDPPPWGRRALVELLDRGPLTFEAEHMPSQREGTPVDDPGASEDRARAVRATGGRAQEPFVLTHGPGLRLPAGSYTARFILRGGCGAVTERAAAAVLVLVDRKVVQQREVGCGRLTARYRSEPLEFQLPRAGAVELWVKYLSGELWHDRTELRRTELRRAEP